MKNILFVILPALIMLTSCEEGDLCSRCNYTRPDNNVIVEGIECFYFYGEVDEEDNEEWEATFKEEVRALGGDWENLEITCERYLPE